MWRGGAGGFLLRTSERTSPSDPRGPRAWEKWVSGSGWALGVNGGARGGRSRPGPRAGLHLGALPPAGPRPLPPPGPSPRPAGTRHSPAPTQPAGSGGSSSATPAKRGPHEGSACARPARGGAARGAYPPRQRAGIQAAAMVVGGCRDLGERGSAREAPATAPAAAGPAPLGHAGAAEETRERPAAVPPLTPSRSGGDARAAKRARPGVDGQPRVEGEI